MIADTVEYSLPHTDKKEGATAKPNDGTIAAFLDTLAALMKPFVGKRPIHVGRERVYDSKSFEFFSVSLGEATAVPNAVRLAQVAEVLSAPLSASLIRIKIGRNRWLIGQLAQRKYWSKTRARLLALEWIGSGFLGKGDAQ